MYKGNSVQKFYHSKNTPNHTNSIGLFFLEESSMRKKLRGTSQWQNQIHIAIPSTDEKFIGRMFDGML